MPLRNEIAATVESERGDNVFGQIARDQFMMRELTACEEDVKIRLH
jgi:hypothetical protein